MAYSYSSGKKRRGRLSELAGLYRAVQAAGPHQRVGELVSFMQRLDSLTEDRAGVPLRAPSMLDVGCGQFLRHALYFACLGSSVVGIDTDVVPRSWRPDDYARMLVRNGPMRTVKTVGRKALGVDRRFRRAMRAHLSVTRERAIRVLATDAAAMPFEDAAFDRAFSIDVFEHLPEPERVAREMARAVRPGGVAVAVVHLYTSDTGCHDLAVMSGSRGEIPLWPHLRPDARGAFQESAYLNRLRLDQWRRIFAAAWPGSSVETIEVDPNPAEEDLRRLRESGELSEYADEELLRDRVLAVWRRS